MPAKPLFSNSRRTRRAAADERFFNNFGQKVTMAQSCNSFMPPTERFHSLNLSQSFASMGRACCANDAKFQATESECEAFGHVGIDVL